jgi:hypothetical protein
VFAIQEEEEEVKPKKAAPKGAAKSPGTVRMLSLRSLLATPL